MPEDAATPARPRTRRALLGAALGATAAAAVTALVKPETAAATAATMQTGFANTPDAPTGLFYSGGTALYVAASGMPEVAPGGVLKAGSNSADPALDVVNTQDGAFAVRVSTLGLAAVGVGVESLAAGSKGMQVQGGSIGVDASAEDATNGTGVAATAFGTGSVGVSGYGATGVLGDALSGSGIGVRGTATTGVGGQFSATTGTALKVTGKVRTNRSGRASIAKNATYVDVTVSGGLSGSPLCFANLATYRSGVHVAAVTPNSTTGKIRIRLNKAASTTSSTSVSWFVLA